MNNLRKKLKESLISVLPITVIVLILNFAVSPMPKNNLGAFLLGALFLVLGMGLYSIGTEVAIEPIGNHIGSKITKTKKLSVILPVCLLIGIIVTIAEPDLTVLAEQVSTIPSRVLIYTIAFGVGAFLVLAVLRIALKVPLRYILIVLYGILFFLAAFVDKEFIPLAFDSGGVTTGPITVPFIMALGIGISAVLGGNNSQDSSFGIIGICSVGPIIAVLLLGLFYHPEGSAEIAAMSDYASFSAVLGAFGKGMLGSLKEVSLALFPILAFFLLFQIFFLKLPKKELCRILFGVLYTLVGLTIFLTGAYVGFMSAGSYIGGAIAVKNAYLLIPVGMVVGAFIVMAEPAVHVLNNQVEEITGGTIKKSTMMIVLACAIAVAIGLAMLRVVTGISIWYVILPGYGIALLLSFFVPKIFTAIAFDSGGVASGPMTTTFLLPLALGAANAIPGANLLTDAFGIVATVAMTPLVAIQVLGLIYKLRVDAENRRVSHRFRALLQEEGDEIIDYAELEKAPSAELPASAPAEKKRPLASIIKRRKGE